MEWFASKHGWPGRPGIFSETDIQFCLSIRVLLDSALWQTMGMMASRRDWPVPDYSTLCRRQKTVTTRTFYCRSGGDPNLLFFPA